ncbi:MAG: helix-turn-helix transcriptional regulator [Opitutaceae bacterium]|nr:helix-turn-helix transcriptional regulator [Opitutaceae bacterium]
MKTPEQIQNELQAMMAAARQTHAFKLESAKMEFTEDMLKLLDARDLSQSDLAKRIGSSPAYITKILRGTSNFTLDTMVKIASALDAEFRCHLQARGTQTLWVDYEVAQPRHLSVRLPTASEVNDGQFTQTPVPPINPGPNETLPAAA